MQSLTHNDLLRNFERALAKSEFSAAQALASKAATYYEGRDEFKYAGYWLRREAFSLLHQGRYAEGSIKAARAAEIQPDHYERSLALHVLAANQIYTSRPNNALVALGRAEEIARSFRSKFHLKAILSEAKAVALWATGDIDQAVIDLENAAELLDKVSYPWRAGVPFNDIGFTLAGEGRLKESEQWLTRAMERVEKGMPINMVAGIHDSIGYTYTLMGRYADAEAHLEESARLFSNFSNKAQLVDTLLHLSELHERKRNWKLARQQASRALSIATDINFEHLCKKARNRLSSIDSCRGNNFTAVRTFHGMICASDKMKSVAARLKIIAAIDELALILGETGTGKELAARAIHQESKRRAAPFVPFNCSALSRELIESRLFGHRKGAFTGAHDDQPGIMRSARGGTVFLDEIGDLPIEAQGALLRFLQSKEMQPVGSSKPVTVDVRIVAATNRDLREDAEAGRFRKDLYYRLNAMTLVMPPLWMRREDIGELARHFGRIYSERYGLPEPVLASSEMMELAEYDWPGNVRELENYIRQRVVFGEARLETVKCDSRAQERGWRALNETEKQERIKEALKASSGNVTAAARSLGLSRRTIQVLRSRQERG